VGKIHQVPAENHGHPPHAEKTPARLGAPFLQEDLTRRGENPRSTFEIINALREDALVIGFARRFATYKRATLLFSNEKRLAEIVNNADRPVMFLFAGKAHPADKAGRSLSA
jgi:starch phosphorylase